MTTPTDRPARQALYSELMWPKWKEDTESYGTGQEKAEALLNAHAAEALAAALTTRVEQQPAPAEEPETDEQRADRLETERLHATGDHEYCGLTCEAEFPSEMLRNGILARAIPGSAAMLDELLRRTAAGTAP